MNEDDTFRHLWRMPWNELWAGPVDRDEEIFTDFIFKPFHWDEIDALTKYGWTELEFKKEYKKVLEAEDTHSIIRGYEWWLRFENEIRRLEELNDRR